MSTVVVIGPNQRRLNVKVTPSTALHDVLSQACDRFGLAVDSFALKHGKRTLDLTLPFRLSGLTNGAKLDLMKRADASSSKNTIITVALQSLDDSIPRVIHKFLITTTIWQILKFFEERSAGKLNLTQRAAEPSSITQGAGRLYYMMPTINLSNKEIGSFEELNKSLAAYGYTSGTCLLRIRFVATTIPLEEALDQVIAFTGGIVTSGAEASTSGLSSTSDATSILTPAEEKEEPLGSGIVEESKTGLSPKSVTEASAGEPMEDITPSTTAENRPPQSIPLTNPTPGPDNRAISIFQPGTSAVPVAASLPLDEKDFEMSVNQAKAYQSHLQKNTINKRLLTDAQKREQEMTERNRRLAVERVDIKVRFPEGSMVQSVFTQTDTGKHLYNFAKGLLSHPDGGQAGAEYPFVLMLPGPKQPALPVDEKLVILDLGIYRPTVIDFHWKEDVDEKIRKSDPLNDEYRAKARQVEVPKQIEGKEEDDDSSSSKMKALGKILGGGGKDKSEGSSGKKPAWFKLGKK